MYMGFNMFQAANHDRERYLNPRLMFDEAIISDKGGRCIYDEKAVLRVLTADYKQGYDEQYKWCSEQARQMLARREAIKFMRFLQLGCYLYHGPLIINLSTNIEL